MGVSTTTITILFLSAPLQQSLTKAQITSIWRTGSFLLTLTQTNCMQPAPETCKATYQGARVSGWGAEVEGKAAAPCT